MNTDWDDYPQDQHPQYRGRGRQPGRKMSPGCAVLLFLGVLLLTAFIFFYGACNASRF